MTKYFNLKIQRQTTINKGGITYYDGSVAFPSGTQFSITDEDTFVGFDDIIEYLVVDRLQRSRKSIDNAVSKAIPGKKQASFMDALLSEIPVVHYDAPLPGGEFTEQARADFIEKVVGVSFSGREGFYIIRTILNNSAFTNYKYSLYSYINADKFNYSTAGLGLDPLSLQSTDLLVKIIDEIAVASDEEGEEEDEFGSGLIFEDAL